MNTSLAWIKAYVPDLDVEAQEFADAMTLSGSKVEGYEKFDADLDKIIIGQIVKIEKHPDADKLIICQVNIGQEEPIQIVTGAPNVKVCSQQGRRGPADQGAFQRVDREGHQCECDRSGLYGYRAEHRSDQ